MKFTGAVVAAAIAIIFSSCRTPDSNSETQDSTVPMAAAAPASPGNPGSPPVGPQFKIIKQSSLEPDIEALAPDELAVCSFNVSFVGHWKARDKKSEELAQLLQPCDIIAMQELVSPPTNLGIDANGKVHIWLDQNRLIQYTKNKDPTELIETFTPWWTDTTRPPNLVEEWSADYQSLHFVGHMKKAGFDYVISPGDSGKNMNHNNSTASEWHIAFYRSAKVQPVPETDMPGGWTKLDPQEPLAMHPVFDRVPYAFAFRTTPRPDGKQLDFVLINVHLHSTQTRINENEKTAGRIRARELFYINKWVEKMQGSYSERDFIILGDMNVVSCTQLNDIKQEVETLMLADGMTGLEDYVSLNRGCFPTNISVADPKPFDQVIFDSKHTKEMVRSSAYGADLITVDIATKYGLTTTYNNVVGNFVKSYSDHMPLLFVMKIGQDDD